MGGHTGDTAVYEFAWKKKEEEKERERKREN
jgi:hypothetical protein